jgi:hypothetical protein
VKEFFIVYLKIWPPEKDLHKGKQSRERDRPIFMEDRISIKPRAGGNVGIFISFEEVK